MRCLAEGRLIADLPSEFHAFFDNYFDLAKKCSEEAAASDREVRKDKGEQEGRRRWRDKPRIGI